MAHISEGSSSWAANPYQYYMIDFSLKELKLQKSDMDCWSIPGDCISHTISSLYQCNELVLAAPKNMYEHMIYKIITAPPSIPISQFVTESKVTKETSWMFMKECWYNSKVFKGMMSPVTF